MFLWNLLCLMLVNCIICTKTEIADEHDSCFDVVQRRYDISFSAFLFNKEQPNLLCLGALITDYWVVDNCMDEPGFAYNSIRVGAMGLYNWSHVDYAFYIYQIAKTIIHSEYQRVHFKINGKKKQQVYGANNALCLHKTDSKVIMLPGIVSTIPLYPKRDRPKAATIIYLGERMLTGLQLPTISTDVCNEHFQQYFGNSDKISVNRKQFCFNTRCITPKMCCHSHALLLYRGQLAGIMAWSSVCSQRYGVDPWVFTVLIYYRSFIRNATNLEHYTALQSYLKRKHVSARF